MNPVCWPPLRADCISLDTTVSCKDYTTRGAMDGSLYLSLAAAAVLCAVFAARRTEGAGVTGFNGHGTAGSLDPFPSAFTEAMGGDI